MKEATENVSTTKCESCSRIFSSPSTLRSHVETNQCVVTGKEGANLTNSNITAETNGWFDPHILTSACKWLFNLQITPIINLLQVYIFVAVPGVNLNANSKRLIKVLFVMGSDSNQRKRYFTKIMM